MNYYKLVISPETIKRDLSSVNYLGTEVGIYSAMTQILTGNTNNTSLLTGLTIPILITQDVNDVGYFDPFDGEILQKDTVSNFLFSSTTTSPYDVYVYNTSEQYQKFIELSEYKIDWGDGSPLQTITNFSPSFINHTYPIQNRTYNINVIQKNPFGTIRITKKISLPYSNLRITNPSGTAYFTSNVGAWSATPVSYDYIYSYDSVNTIDAQSTTGFTQTPYIVSGTSVSKLQDLEQYGSQKYIVGLDVYKNRTLYGKVNSITNSFTGYTILDIDYYDYSDGTTIFFFTGTGFNQNNIVAEPITKQEVLLNVIDQPQIRTNVYVERGKNSAYERLQRLGEVDTVGDMINYGYGFFNIEIKA
jgi:hypothetical protein